MKNTLLLLPLIFLLSTPSFGQFGSSEKETENLFYLCKIWGYIKYFHPNIQECSVDWDLALIESLEEMNGADQEQFELLVDELIDKAGPIPLGDGSSIPEIPTDPKLNNFDISWFNDEPITDYSSNALNNLYQYSKKADHCQLIGSPYASFMNFLNEDPYDELGAHPPTNYRILAMFRYWTIIDYFFPYKYLMDQDWNTTFYNQIHPIVDAQDDKAYLLAFLSLTTFINDSHGGSWSPTYAEWRGVEYNPYRIKHIEDQTLIVEVHESFDELEVGDIILSKNNVPIQEIRDSLKLYICGSNTRAINRRINFHLIFSTDEDFILEVEKEDGTTKSVAISPSREKYLDLHINESIKPSWSTLTGECAEYGYIDMGELEREEVPQLVEELWDKDILIFDLRSYPNSTFYTLRNLLFNETQMFALFSNPNDQFAGIFNWYNGHPGANHEGPIFEGQIIILFNEATISQAEFHVMGLETHHRAIKIGNQTAGADGDITKLFLPGLIETRFTSLGVYYPDQSETQRIGIVPDIEVHPTINGIREGRDEILEAALQCSLVDESTSHVSPENNLDISISPNPFNSEIIIEHQSSDATSVTLYNAIGQKILDTEFKKFQRINTTSLASGVYFLYIRSIGILELKTMVKQ